jgi:hypothetical protein
VTKRGLVKGTDHLRRLSTPVRFVVGGAGVLVLAASLVAAIGFRDWLMALAGGAFSVLLLMSAWMGKDFWDNPPTPKRKRKK